MRINRLQTSRVCPAWIGVALTVIAALLAVRPLPVSAHPEIETQLAHLSRLIEAAEAQAGSADLFLQRGELHRVHEDWDQALSDFERALALDASLSLVHFCRGRLFLERGEPRRAVADLTDFLKRAPGDPRGLALRARAHAALHDYAAADADYTGAVDRSELPAPELILEWAECRLASDAMDEGKRLALAALDRGIDRLGPLAALQGRAIDIECARGDFDAAIGRIDRAIASQGVSPLWLKRKAETLAAAGRSKQAAVVYREALAEIDSLPEHRRSVRAFRAMRGEIEGNLAVLHSQIGARKP